MNRAWLVLLTALLASCAGVRFDPAEAVIDGIGVTASSSDAVDVLLIHGMGYHDQAWAASANAALAKALGRGFDSTAFMKTKGTPLGKRGAMFYPGTLAGGPGQINTYAVVWAPIVTAWKKTLCYDASVALEGVCPKANGESRALANGYLKSVLLDGALSDVVFYTSDDGAAIRHAVGKAVLMALSGTQADDLSPEDAFARMADRHAPVFIMSESLGSKILRDSVIELANDPQHHDTLLLSLGRIREVYMAANQMPILSPTEARAPHVSEHLWTKKYAEHAPLTGLRGFSALVREGRLKRGESHPPPLKIVAFSDPNDVLTYRLRPYFNGQCEQHLPNCDPDQLFALVDVQVSNDIEWFWLLESPWTAHTTYWENRNVQRVISCGNPKKANCM